MVPSSGKKPLSTAVEEIYKGKVHILPEEAEVEEETTEENEI
jgi:DNA-directed RNA polymerase subunit omega